MLCTFTIIIIMLIELWLECVLRLGLDRMKERTVVTTSGEQVERGDHCYPSLGQWRGYLTQSSNTHPGYPP